MPVQNNSRGAHLVLEKRVAFVVSEGLFGENRGFFDRRPKGDEEDVTRSTRSFRSLPVPEVRLPETPT